MAPKPTMPVFLTVILASLSRPPPHPTLSPGGGEGKRCEASLRSCILVAQFCCCGFVDVPFAVWFDDGDAVVGGGAFGGNITLCHIGEHLSRFSLKRITQAAAAGRFQAEYVSSLQRIIGVARGQMLFVRRARIDCKIAGASRSAVLRTQGRNDVLGRTDGKAGVGEIDVFAQDAEAAAEFS